MKCPECQKWTEVLESVLRDDGSRRRRYQCANLHRFSTVERVEEIKQGEASFQIENENITLCAFDTPGKYFEIK